jgi:hypothetical protein
MTKPRFWPGSKITSMSVACSTGSPARSATHELSLSHTCVNAYTRNPGHRRLELASRFVNIPTHETRPRQHLGRQDGWRSLGLLTTVVERHNANCSTGMLGSTLIRVCLCFWVPMIYKLDERFIIAISIALSRAGGRKYNLGLDRCSGLVRDDANKF